ncbi:MAG: SBBP repeat-containing protein, partial [Phycisphaeraceae bacterium]
SSDFPTTAGAHDTSHNGGADAFVTRLNATGELAWSTYLGGADYDTGYGIAVDDAGAVYVTGRTGSSDFPTTAGAHDTSHNGGDDAFVARLSGTGELAWSTYLGGADWDWGYGIAVDGAGAVYVTGYTRSSNFPTTAGAHDTSHDGFSDAFVARLSATGELAWSTYLGGADYDTGYGIAVDDAGAVYVTGRTGSSDFPTTAGAHDTSHNGGDDAFVARLSATGELAWSTYLGGAASDGGRGIAVDGAGAVYVTGGTDSSDFPTTAGAHDTSHNGNADAFIAKFAGSVADATYHAWVAGTGAAGLRLRAGASLSDDVLTVMPEGARVEVLDDETITQDGYDWLPVRYNQWQGWTALQYLSTEGGTEADAGDGTFVFPLGDGAMATPANDGDGWYDAQGFGAWNANFGKYHLGEDWNGEGGGNTDLGEPVYAIGDGEIVFAGQGTGWGNVTIVRHTLPDGSQVESLYGHLDAFTVTTGHVSRGQQIGTIGTGGGLYAAHLHLEVRTPDASAWGQPGPGYSTTPEPAGWLEPWAFIASRHDAGGLDGGEAEGRPDLVLDDADLTLAAEDGDQRVSAVVRNTGSAPAEATVVRFVDVARDEVVGTVAVESLTVGETAAVSVLWDPPADGGRIEATVDPWGEARERSRSNNRATVQYAPQSGNAPYVLSVTGEHDGNTDPRAFGRYVEGVSLLNEFTAMVVPGGSDAVIDRVEFSLGDQQRTVDGLSNIMLGGTPWSTMFDMGDVSGTQTLEVVAYDTDGLASDPWTGTVHAVSFPSWLGEPDGDDVFADGHYELRRFEGLDFSHEIESSSAIIDGLDSSFRIGAELGLTAGLDTEGPMLSVDDRLVFESTVLGYELFNYSGDKSAFELSDSITLDVNATADPQDLMLNGLSGAFSVTDLSLGEFETPKASYSGAIGPVPVNGKLGLSGSFVLDGQINYGWDAVNSVVSLGEGSYLEPSMGVSPEVTGTLGIPWALEGGVTLEGDVGLNYRTTYDTSEPDNLDKQWAGTFSIDASLITVTVGYEHEWASQTIPEDGPWTISNETGTTSTMTASSPLVDATTTTVEDAALWPEPHLTADAHGNVLLTRVIDADADPDAVNASIGYAVRGSDGAWSGLSPLASSNEIETGSVAAYTGEGGAVASWIANTSDPSQIDTIGYEDYLANQELRSAYWDGSTWAQPQAVTDNGRMDGRPALAFHDGQGLMMWARAGDTSPSDPSGHEIYYAVWDATQQAWGTPSPLNVDPEPGSAPHVAYAPNGTAMAVWTHEDDGDPATAQIRYATWDGSAWSDSAVAASADEGAEGLTQLRVGFDSTGHALLAWVERGDDADVIRSMRWDATDGAWSDAETVLGGANLIEGLDLAISDQDEAVLTWQGWDGQSDLFSSRRDLSGDGGWQAVRQLTDTVDREWRASTTFDSDGERITVWSNEYASGVFGEGAGSVELSPVPDLAASELRILDDQPLEGGDVKLRAVLANEGWASSDATNVTFYEGDPNEGGTVIGSPVEIGALDAGESTSVLSDTYALPAGTTEIYVQVTPLVEEADTLNNIASATVMPASPDQTGPQVTLTSDDAQPAGADRLALQFDEPVRVLGEADLAIVEADRGLVVPDQVTLSPDQKTVTVLFEGGLRSGSYSLRVIDSVTDEAGNALDGDENGQPGGDFVSEFVVDGVLPEVRARHVFYNDSSFDGDDASANASDDGAIASDKEALLPGESANFANYTSYAAGLNGIMVDIAGLAEPANLSASDFAFATGNDDAAGDWSSLTGDVAVSVREGAGVGGSDRVTLIWDEADAVKGAWLEVTVQANATTGLNEADVFYFGNAIGETGNLAGDAQVNAQDAGGVRENLRNFLNPAPIDDPYDFDRDQNVNASDYGLVRENLTNFLNALHLIEVPEAEINSNTELMQQESLVVATSFDDEVTSSDTMTSSTSDEIDEPRQGSLSGETSAMVTPSDSDRDTPPSKPGASSRAVAGSPVVVYQGAWLAYSAWQGWFDKAEHRQPSAARWVSVLDNASINDRDDPEASVPLDVIMLEYQEKKG